MRMSRRWEPGVSAHAPEAGWRAGPVLTLQPPFLTHRRESNIVFEAKFVMPGQKENSLSRLGGHRKGDSETATWGGHELP